MLKRGVSPLIATVLLVMIVVSIGAAVMVVIQGLSEEQIQTIEHQREVLKCSGEVDIQIVKVSTNYRLCKNTTEIVLQMENKGLLDIAAFDVLVIGDTIIRTENVGNKFSKGNFSTYAFTYNTTANPVKVAILPRIGGTAASTDAVVCEEQDLIFESEDLDSMITCATTGWPITSHVTAN